MQRLRAEGVPAALAADAVGTLVGYAASWLLLLPFGVSAYGVFAAIMLTLAAWTLPRVRA